MAPLKANIYTDAQIYVYLAARIVTINCSGKQLPRHFKGSQGSEDHFGSRLQSPGDTSGMCPARRGEMDLLAASCLLATVPGDSVFPALGTLSGRREKPPTAASETGPLNRARATGKGQLCAGSWSARLGTSSQHWLAAHRHRPFLGEAAL